MFGLKYLNNDKKKLLRRLEERLAKATSPQVRNESQLAIQEIMAQAKPYTECDLLEADELRSQIFNNINILAGLGKVGSAEVFRVHLKDVEFHMQTIQMAEMLKEQQDKFSPDEGPNLIERSSTPASVLKDRKRKEAFAQHRWVIGFEDEPDDENK